MIYTLIQIISMDRDEMYATMHICSSVQQLQQNNEPGVCGEIELPKIEWKSSSDDADQGLKK